MRASWDVFCSLSLSLVGLQSVRALLLCSEVSHPCPQLSSRHAQPRFDAACVLILRWGLVFSRCPN